MDHLSAPVEWKAAGDSSGQLDGYGVFFNNVDMGDDVALPGSAKKTLADRRASGRPFPLIADHELKTSGVIGSVVSAQEDHLGVRLRASFASTRKAQDIRQLALEGHVGGLSMSYEPLRFHFAQKDGRQIRYLDEIRIHEFTVTPFPMNPEAKILAVKAAEALAGDDLDEEMSFEVFEKAMAAVLQIPVLGVRKSATHLLVASYRPTEATAAGPADGQPTAVDAAADTGTPADGTAQKATDPAAEYALSIISKPSGPPDGAPGAEPPKALVDPLQALETQRYRDDLDQLEAQVQTALGGTK